MHNAHVVDLVEFDAFGDVGLLLEFERVLIEVLLQLLIGVVDAKLLKAIVFENFKAENVEDANGARALLAGRGSDGLVDLLHNPVEDGAKQKFGEDVASICSQT